MTRTASPANTETFHSRIYRGKVRHRRHFPKPHAFEYELFQVYLDLDEAARWFGQSRLWSLHHWNLAWLRREDFLAPHDLPLKAAVLNQVEMALGFRPNGAVRMLAHLRYFGVLFNPVTFYYCFDTPNADSVESNGNLVAIVAEITNTPWNESHCYALDCRTPRVPDQSGGPCETRRADDYQFEFPKAFHVSPFNPMDMDYAWRFSEPGERLFVHMNLWRQGRREFDATLSYSAEAADGRTLDRMLLCYPWMTLKVIAGIYWQALKLYLKGNPVYDHPSADSTSAPLCGTRTESSLAPSAPRNSSQNGRQDIGQNSRHRSVENAFEETPHG